MDIAEVIDYAYPCMMAENALKEVHLAMIAQNHEAAIEAAHKTLVEVKMTLNSIVLMQEKAHALHKVS
jgi:hypothetical protein